jgi:trk system potassium uptake protein TrkH
MHYLLQKIPFLIELFISGPFIVFYGLVKYKPFPIKLPSTLVGQIFEVQSQLIPFFILLSLIVHYLNSNRFEDYFRKNIFSIMILVPLIITWGDLEFSFWLSSIHLLSSLLNLSSPESTTSHFIDRKKDQDPLLKIFQLEPAQIVLITFAVLILGGALLLALPLSSADGKGLNFVDALFMSTSAACVTGLATVQPGSDLSFFGQVILLLLVQIGGLGTMILYASMTILMGKSMPIKEQLVMQDILDVSTLEELIRVIVDILIYTFVIEFWTAMILTLGFSLEGFEFSRSLYFGFYHAITAFCNAGFALFDNNLENFAVNPLITMTIAFSIILGGIGFSVLKESKQLLLGQKTIYQMSMHSKIVLTTTVFLLFAGTSIVFFSEFLNSLDGLNLWEKFQISFFQSVTLRTAGFNSIPLVNFHSHTLYLLIMFMFIGGSPGSTAGGIKTTSLAILIQSIRATLRGKDRVEMFQRTIPNSVVVKNSALFLLALMSTSGMVYLMMIVENDKSFLALLFEVVSAFGTVGLSLNLTPSLGVTGKLLISAMMYIGRVGPLTLVLGLGQQGRDSGQVEYPAGKVMIG